MHKLRRIDIEHSKELIESIKEFAQRLKKYSLLKKCIYMVLLQKARFMKESILISQTLLLNPLYILPMNLKKSKPLNKITSFLPAYISFGDSLSSESRTVQL